MNNQTGRIVLAIETGIDGGSVSILENDKLLAGAHGSMAGSRSEDILLLAESLLNDSSITKSEISLIAASDGPGSLTGLRIGRAIAKGFSQALSIPHENISVLDAMALLIGRKGKVITALEEKSKKIYYREYVFNETTFVRVCDSIRKVSLDEFESFLEKYKKEEVFIVGYGGFEAQIMYYFQKQGSQYQGFFFDSETNLAEIVGQGISRMSDWT